MKLLIQVLILNVSLSAFADSFSAYEIPTIRDGIKTQRLTYNFWSGEYPGPGTDIKSEVTVEAYSSVRTLGEPSECTIEKGRYSPLSQTKSSAINYYTIIDLFSYESITTFVDSEIYKRDDLVISDNNMIINTGDKIINVFYGSEGWCFGKFIRKNGETFDVDFSCGMVEDETKFVSTGSEHDYNNRFYEQWVYLQCKEGHNAFIKDGELLKFGTLTSQPY